MSANYRKIYPDYWTGPTARAMRGKPDAQRVAFYLMTCSHSNMIGVFTCPPAYIANDLGMTIEGASEALRTLSEGGFCMFDETTDLVWVIDLAEANTGKALKPSDKQVISTLGLYRSIPNRLFRQRFFERYGVAYHLEPVEGDADFGSPFGAPSEALRSKEKEQQQEKEQKQEQEPLGSSLRSEPCPSREEHNPPIRTTTVGACEAQASGGEPGTKPPKGVLSLAEQVAFDAWWEHYPHKVAKAATVPIFGKLMRSGRPGVDMLCDKAMLYGEWLLAWERAGRPRTPCNPTTWLNQARWNDELAWPSQAQSQQRGQWSSMEDHLTAIGFKE